MQEPDPEPGQLARGQALVLLGGRLGLDPEGLADQRADDEGAVTGGHLLVHPGPGSLLAAVALAGQPLGRDGHAARGQLVEGGEVEVAEDHHGGRARDRRRRHDQEVGIAVGSLGAQRRPLLHAEAVLLVDHHAPERGERDLLGEQRMGAHDDADLPRGQAVEHRAARLALDPAREQLDPDLAARHATGALEVAEQRAHGREVLFGQHLGRHHQRALVPALHRGEQRGQRHDRLARPDVALEQAVHRERARHVGHDDGEGAALGRRQLVGQRGQEARHQRVGHAAGDLAGRHVVMQGAGVHLEGAAAQHQRQLRAEQLVEDEAAPRRCPWPRRTRAGGSPSNASVRPHSSSEVRHSAGSGSANSPARSSASATKEPISQLVSPTLAEAGYTGRMRSVRRPGVVTPATTSTTGLAIWRLPRYSVTFPKKIASVPASSCLARQGWLKKTILSRPVSSRTTTSTTARPVRGPPGVRRLHGGEHRRLVADHEVGHVGLARAVDVAPRVGREQIEHGLDAELGQHRGPPLRHAVRAATPRCRAARSRRAAATQSPTGTGREAGRPGALRARRRGAPRTATPRSVSCPPCARPRPR